MIKFYDILKAMHLHYSGDYFTGAITHRYLKPLYTVLGTLPITLPTKPRLHSFEDWIIYGNAEGVGERTKNLISVPSIAPVTDHGVTFMFDPVAGTITANGTATGGQGRYAIYIEPTETINLYLSGCPAGGSASSYNAYPWDSTAGARPKKWDGVTAQTDSDYGNGDLEVQVPAGHIVSITLRIEAGYTANNVVFKPMYREEGTTSDFIPFGYQIPITVSQTGQTNKNYEIFVGDTPLGEGETVSQDTSDIRITVEPDLETTFSTTLENKPEMKILYR